MSDDESKPKAKAKAAPKPKAKAAPKSEAKPEVKSEGKPEPKSEAKAKPKSEPKPKANPKSKAAPKNESKSKGDANPKSKAEPKNESKRQKSGRGQQKGNGGQQKSRGGQQKGKDGHQKGRGKRDGKGKKSSRRDFFEDLRELETHQIADMLNDNKSSSRSVESQLESLENERKSLISTVQVLRTALYDSGGVSKERRELLNELRGRNQQINEAKSVRDDINERISPPLNLIERLLKRTWRDLTTIREDASRAPNLANEIQKFSFFFELQVMHKLKLQSDSAHQQFVDMIRKQKETIRKLDELQNESTGIATKAADENPRLSGTKISRKEERDLNDRIEKMLAVIRNKRIDLRKFKREIGRLESFSRIRKDDESRGRKVRKRINTLREHAMSGGSLSMEDMARILETGGLSQLQSSGTQQTPQRKKKSTRRGGRNKTQPRRGVARSHQRRED